MAEIYSKDQFYKLHNAGLLGNKARHFDTWIQARDWALEQEGRTIGVRQRVADGKFTPHVQPQDLIKLITYMYHVEKIRVDQLHFSEMMPDHLVLVRGYVSRGTIDTAPWILDYSEEKMTSMQAIMKRPKHLEGLAVYWKLRGLMDPESWDTLNELYERYPDAIIEFGCYPCPVGDLGYNTIFWEVRNY